MSVADFLHPTAEEKPDCLGVKSQEQDAQESLSGGRGTPCTRPSETLCHYPSQASSQGTAAPLSPFAHTTSRGASCSQYACCVGRELLLNSIHGLGDYRISWLLEYADSMLMFISFSQKLGLLSFCCVLWSRRGQGHWRICCLI